MHIYWTSVVAFVAILRCTTADPMIYGTADLEHDWAEAFKLIITVKMQYPVSNGWRMALIFSQPIKKIDVWRAEWMDTEVSKDKTITLSRICILPKNWRMERPSRLLWWLTKARKTDALATSRFCLRVETSFLDSLPSPQ